ncbi:MAG: hypothetical protein ACI9UU_001030 [Candidatus Azotimanducaceae bacterium]|jgi:hypothetical protein
MSDTTIDTEAPAPETASEASNEAANASTKNKDLERAKRIGAWHATAIFASLTLWGSANAWAQSSGLIIAYASVLAMAIAAATVIASIVHEWGHFSGAKLSGAIAPVERKPIRFYFMFNFDMEQNTDKQFLAMSLGGISANWLLVILLLVLVPLNSIGAAMLVAVAVAKAINVSVFEMPIFKRVYDGGVPNEELQRQLKEQGLRQLPGYVMGALAFLAFT